MRYPIHNRLAYYSLYTIDHLLKCFIRNIDTQISKPRSLLLCNGAHLGDVILTTALLIPLKEAYPELRIGMIVGSWAKEAVRDHPLIDTIHLVDHWKLNRSPLSKKEKCKYYLTTRRKTLQELLTIKYDAAVDTRFHFPNSAPLLWQAKIPVRIGFESAGFGPLLTHPRPWNPKENRSAVDAFFSLLECYNVKRFTRPAAFSEKENKYIVVHMGSGDPKKEWPLEKWRSLTKQLVADGHELYFTGLGERERRAIESLHVKNNLCDQLNWSQFVSLIRNASLLIGVDSAAGHLAAEVGVPSVLIYTGIHPSKLWQPVASNAQIVTYPITCSPCLTGCSSMECVRNISVSSVYQAICTAQFNASSFAGSKD